MLEDQLQELTGDTCGIFQLYFHNNLLDSDSNSKIFNDKFLTTTKKKTVTTLLNDIFSTNKETKEKEMKLLAKDKNL